METKRLIIRKPELKDAKELNKIHNSEFVLKYNCMKPTDVTEMEKSIADYQEINNSWFVLEHKQTHQVIGAIFLGEDELRYQVNSKMLSYYLDETFAHQGYMKEALQTILNYCINTLGLSIISARVFSENTASWKLLEKLGFTCEGELKQAVRGYNNIVYCDRLYALHFVECQAHES